MQLGRDESRALVRDHDVVYVYHNLIDKTGDTRDTEERVFAAAEETLEELIRIIKKLTNANANNVLVTADHGFIYQNRAIGRERFLMRAQGDDFVPGSPLCAGNGAAETTVSFKTFTPEQLGSGRHGGGADSEVHQPLRLKGSGSRFVHGGATLQEVVIPVLSINKKRQSDVSRVEVEIIGGGARPSPRARWRWCCTRPGL
jgi:hypothetical protein